MFNTLGAIGGAYFLMRLNALQVYLRSKQRIQLYSKTLEAKPLFAIFVPGLLGVKLKHYGSQELLWGSAKALFKRPLHYDSLQYDDPLVLPDEAIQKFTIIPHLLELMVYQEITDSLKYGSKLILNKNLFFLSYDWRKDYRNIGTLLRQQIQTIQSLHGDDVPIVLIGQSMANLGIKHYLRYDAHAKSVNIKRWYSFGPPWRGSFNTLDFMQKGYYPGGKLLHGFSPQYTFAYPSTYQLLPQQAKLVNHYGESIDTFNLYDAQQWFDYNIANIKELPQHLAKMTLQHYLDDAQAFAQELAGEEGYEATISQLSFVSDRNQALTHAVWDEEKRQFITSLKTLQHYPKSLQEIVLEPGDEHIPLSHYTHYQRHPLIRHYALAPLGEPFIAISNQPSEHRKLINFSPNIDLMIKDMNYIRKVE